MGNTSINAGTILAETIGSINFMIDGGGNEIITGIKGDVRIPSDLVIQSVTLLADTTGNIVVDIWKDTYGAYPPTDANSITASAVPTITGGIKYEDTTLTGWTKNCSEGETLRYNVDSVVSITRVNVILKFARA